MRAAFLLWLALSQHALAAGVDKAAMKDVIVSHHAEIKRCYPQALVALPYARAAKCPAVERFWVGFERRFRTDPGTRSR